MSGFVDEAQVHVKAGDGGAGCVSFRREAHVSKGGPDGGNGGVGGTVYLEASRSVVSLLSFRDHPHRRAGDGTHGSGARKHGKNGGDVIVAVPEGTIVQTADGAVLADLRRAGERLLAAEGGRGGRGNARFLSNRLRAPAFAEQGEFGEERWLNLELKLIADVALVGFPNAGKSTLISSISAARPKIADYPFTTLEPHLGVVSLDRREDREGSSEFVVADIPGIIEGASEGRGLGHQFLRHIERARVLLVLADLSPDALHSPSEQVRILRNELKGHRPELLDRPMVVVGSRADTLLKTERPQPSSYGGNLEISASTHEGLDELVQRLMAIVKQERVRMPEVESAPVIHRPVPEGVVVTKDGALFVVEGRDAKWAVGLSDLNDADAISLVQRRLSRLGITKALERAGAQEGDTVVIGKMSFTFTPDH